MPADSVKAKSIFLQAVEGHQPAEWQAFLDEACVDRPELRREVEVLLEAHAQAGAFLEQGAVVLDRTVHQPLAEQPGTLIGPYKLLQKVGEGGMGVVYMAEQTEPVERRVALKIIKPGMDTQQVIARFEAERQALAMMDHPNIAKVLTAGTTVSGRPYFVMELVKGISITQYCDNHHLTPSERLELFAPVCQAVQHAHQKGVIHRDIKPTNVLVAEYDDRAVPKIIDFGVAKAVQQRLTEKTMFTQFGQIVGTLEYMSPEQAQFNQLDVDTRSDIYSLGVLLYELLTGTTPLERGRLRSAGFDEMMRMLRDEDPPKPSVRLSTSAAMAQVAASRRTDANRLGQLVRGDLDWIVMKALSKDRARRYATAAEMAADVHRHLQHEPVLAGPPTLRYRAGKFLKKHRLPAASAALALLLLVIGLAVSSFLYVRSERMRTLASGAQLDAEQRQKETAEALSDLTAQESLTRKALADLRGEQQRTREALNAERRSRYFNQIALAQLNLLANDVPRTRQLLAQAAEKLRGWEWRYLNHVSQPELVIASRSPNGVDYDPVGRRIVAPNDGGRAVTVWDAATAAPLVTYRGHSLDIPPDSDGCKQIYACAFSPSGAKIASATSDDGAGLYAGELHVWDSRSGKLLYKCDGHEGGIYHLAFSADGRLLASMSSHGWKVKLWNAETGQLVRTLAKGGYSLSFSPDGKRIASGCSVFDTESGEEILNLREQKVYSIVFSPDGSKLAGRRHGTTDVVVCDAVTGEELLVCHGHRQEVVRVAWSPDGRQVASGTREFVKLGEVKVWNAETGEPLRNLLGATGSIKALAFHPDGDKLVVASNDLRMFDLSHGQMSRAVDGFLQLNAADHSGIVFSHDGSKLIGIGVTGWSSQEKHATWQVKTWNADSGTLLSAIDLPPTPEYIWKYGTPAVNRSGSRVALPVGSSLTLYRTTSGAVQREIVRAEGRITAAAFSIDDRFLAARITMPGGEENPENRSDDERLKTIRYQVWDAETGEPIEPPAGWGLHEKLSSVWTIVRPAAGLEAPLWQVARSPASEWRAAWIEGDRIVVRNLFRYEQLPLELHRPLGGGRQYQVHLRGRELVEYDGVRADRLAEHFAATEPDMTLDHAGATFECLSFNLDGTRLAARDHQGRIYVWNVAKGKEEPAPAGLAAFCGVFGPNGERLSLKTRHARLRLMPDVSQFAQAIRNPEWYQRGFFGGGKNFSPDGRHVIAEIRNDKVQIWDLRESRTIELTAHRDAMCAAFSPGGRRLATGGRDGALVLWDTASWQEILTLEGHTASVVDIVFSDDGHRLATTSVDGTVRFWDAPPPAGDR